MDLRFARKIHEMLHVVLFHTKIALFNKNGKQQANSQKRNTLIFPYDILDAYITLYFKGDITGIGSGRLWHI